MSISQKLINKLLFSIITGCSLGCTFFINSKLESLEAGVFLNVAEEGVNGNDSQDDWESIQRLIDKMLNQGGGTLYFPNGTYIIKDKTLLIWGSNLQLVGESGENTKILRRGKAGWWGELLSISGKSPEGKYYGGFGSTDYNRFVIYKGERTLSKNISIKNITFDSEVPYPSASNNIGLTNAKSVTIENCIVQNAPKSNLAIVNVTDKAKNENIVIEDCTFKNSGQHNVRVISYNQGKKIGNTVIIKNSRFLNVIHKDRAKEIAGDRVHLWYRAGLGGKEVSLEVDNCFFDSTGIITSTVNTNNLRICNSKIKGRIDLNTNRNYPNPKIELLNNRYSTKESKKPIKSNTNYLIK